jgi:hypothetical protein
VKWGQNVPLSYNCANSIGAVDLLFNQAMPCKPNIHPANLIRHAYSIYKHVRANTIGIVTVSPYLLKFAALCLFVETIPIYKAVATGKGNNEFYREWTRSNLKFSLDRHNGIQNLNYYDLPDPPRFSLPSTFKNEGK